MTVAEFDIAGAPLKETLAIVATNHKTVTHWQRIENSFAFYWSNPNLEGAIPLPGPIAVADCEGFIKSALSTVDYGVEPDCDGHVSKSWRVRHKFTPTPQTPPMHSWYVAFVVTPHWNEYHK